MRLSGFTLLVLPPDWAKPDPGETKILAGDFFCLRAEMRAHFFGNSCGFLLTGGEFRGMFKA